VQGVSLARHLACLETVRTALNEAFRTMSRREFRRTRQLPQYEVTPEWVLHHLAQHEAEHRGEIAVIRARAERALARA